MVTVAFSVPFRHAVGGLMLLSAVPTAVGGGTDPVPRGDRILGIDLNEAQGADYDQAVGVAKSVGAQCASLSLNWDDLEPAPGHYADPSNFLYLANAYYPAQGLELDLFIRPVDTDGPHLPADLRGTSFDDRVVGDRFVKLLDFVFSKLPRVELNLIAIGNELTLAHDAGSSFWRQYEVFFRAVKDYLTRRDPELPVGVVGTMYELVGSHRRVMERLNRHSDVVLVSYYPLNGDFSVKDPGVVPGDYDALTRLYRGRPIYVSETGYPSSPLLGSSEQDQSRFVAQTFRAWDAHRAQIRYISFCWLHDISSEKLKELFRYYGSTHARFGAYLGTLGLRTRDGRDKRAFGTLRTHAHVRGWRGP